jgi:hypothetical protein
MSDSDLDAMVERMAREERDDLDRKHGEHIIAAAQGASLEKGRQEQDNALLEAIGRARRTQDGEAGAPDGDEAA